MYQLDKLEWGTYGKGGVEHCAGTCPEHQLQRKRLIDCDTEHLQAILRTQRHIYRIFGFVSAIAHILASRGVEAEAFSDEAERQLFDAIGAARKRIKYA